MDLAMECEKDPDPVPFAWCDRVGTSSQRLLTCAWGVSRCVTIEGKGWSVLEDDEDISESSRGEMVQRGEALCHNLARSGIGDHVHGRLGRSHPEQRRDWQAEWRTSTRRTAQLLKYRFRWVAWEPVALITVDGKRNGHTSFNDTTSGLDVEPRGDEGDIGKIENLSSVRERHCP
jgi:hypothetical protein